MIPLLSVVCITGISFVYGSLFKICNDVIFNDNEENENVIDKQPSKCKFFKIR